MDSGVYTIAPGVDFLGVLSSRLLREARECGDARDLSSQYVFLPTRRSMGALEERLLEDSGGKALLLPQIVPLGDVGELEEDEDLESYLSANSMRYVLTNTERQFQLTRLILHWSERSQSRIAGSPVQAAKLALELGSLLDSAETEGVDLKRLHRLVPDLYAENWQETLEFLKIIIEEWPKFMEDNNYVSEVFARDDGLRSLVKRWEKTPPESLVVAAGSTGLMPATKDLLKCIMSLPRGMVVLPGLDREMEDSVWKGLSWEHPQFAMKLLLGRLKISRKQVKTWEEGVGEETPAQVSRQQLLRLAFYPAEMVDRWQKALGKDADVKQVKSSLAGLNLLEAPGRREEAGMIALLLRDLLETPGKRGALVTSDKELARRVCGEMRRWGIEIYNSAGNTLLESEEMRFACLLGEMAANALSPSSLLAALKHPLARFGMDANKLRVRVSLLERFVLRGLTPSPGIGGLRDALKRSLDDTLKRSHDRNHTARAEKQAGEIGKLIDALERSLSPFESMYADKHELHELDDWMEAHLSALAFAAVEDSGDVAKEFFASLSDNGGGLPSLSLVDYLALIKHLAETRPLRNSSSGKHPRVFIWGLLEARLQRVDLVILGGLNDGVWPRRTHVGAWLNRSMLRELKLNDPEWRIGQEAHNFVQGSMQPKVVLSHAVKVNGTPTMKSRWLLRLEALLQGMGIEHLGEDKNFSKKWLERFKSLDGEGEGMRFEPYLSPKPCPPVKDRPKSFSVTRIEKLIEDPYSIYARSILKLKPLEPLDAPFDAAKRGTLLHAILEEFSCKWSNALPEDIEAELLAIADRNLAYLRAAKPETAVLLSPSLEVLARRFEAFERGRRNASMRLLIEERGEISFRIGGKKHTLSCYADRIEIADGGANICDYKSGAMPLANEVFVGKKPQLPLEALILREGGFGDVAKDVTRLDGLTYISTRTRESLGAELDIREIVPKEGTLDEFVEESHQGLKRLLNAYLDEAQPYLCRPREESRHYAGDYDHLARLLEWSSAASDGDR